MRIIRKRDYNRYGMYTANEYTTSDERADVTERDLPADTKPPVLRRRNYRISPRKGGWTRTKSTSGWRNKAAAEQHEDFHT